MARAVLFERAVKATKTCVKCGSKRIFFSAAIMDRGSGNVALPLAIGRADAITAHEVGQFEVYVCRRCGYSELYVTHPEELERAPFEELKP